MTKKLKSISPLLVVLSMLFIGTLLTNGCYYDNEKDLYGVGCDTTNMVYADVKSIIESNCYACHGNGQKQGDIDLDGYANTKVYVDNDKLLCSITHGADCSAMPQGGPKLGSCQIAKIRNWINDGAPEN